MAKALKTFLNGLMQALFNGHFRWRRPDLRTCLAFIPAHPIMAILTIAGIFSSVLNPVHPGHAADHASLWSRLLPGLHLGEFTSKPSKSYDEVRVHVLRIDPERFELKLLNASASKTGRLLSAKQWCRRHRLLAAINASMYRTDFLTSVSYMRTRTHINNPWLSRDKTILAFDRRRSDVPRVKLIDRQCDDFDAWKPKYGAFVQSIRMISCTGRNVWQPQPQKWSTAAIGIDGTGRVLFVHVRSPLSTHRLINILQALPLDIRQAMYLEGGPQAQLYINTGVEEYEFLGGYTGAAADGMAAARPLPNVIGIVPLKSSIKND